MTLGDLERLIKNKIHRLDNLIYPVFILGIIFLVLFVESLYQSWPVGPAIAVSFLIVVYAIYKVKKWAEPEPQKKEPTEPLSEEELKKEIRTIAGMY